MTALADVLAAHPTTTGAPKQRAACKCGRLFNGITEWSAHVAEAVAAAGLPVIPALKCKCGHLMHNGVCPASDAPGPQCYCDTPTPDVDRLKAAVGLHRMMVTETQDDSWECCESCGFDWPCPTAVAAANAAEQVTK